MNRLWLSDGEEIEILSFGVPTGSEYLFIRVEMDMAEAFRTFQGKTETFEVETQSKRLLFRGFSKIAYIVNEADCVRVALTRPLTFEEVE